MLSKINLSSSCGGTREQGKRVDGIDWRVLRRSNNTRQSSRTRSSKLPKEKREETEIRVKDRERNRGKKERNRECKTAQQVSTVASGNRIVKLIAPRLAKFRSLFRRYFLLPFSDRDANLTQIVPPSLSLHKLWICLGYVACLLCFAVDHRWILPRVK